MNPPLRLADAERLRLICELLDEAYTHYFRVSDGYTKAGDGSITLHIQGYEGRVKGAPAIISIYSIPFGPSRTNHFDTMVDALNAVMEWHAAEMVDDHPDPWAQQGDDDA